MSTKPVLAGVAAEVPKLDGVNLIERVILVGETPEILKHIVPAPVQVTVTPPGSDVSVKGRIAENVLSFLLITPPL